MKYTYYLSDNGGCSDIDIEILLPIGSRFRHEFGIYEVKRHINYMGNTETKFKSIEAVDCERVFSNKEIAEGKHRK